MVDFFSVAHSVLPEDNLLFSAVCAFAWGLGSALLSPCHLGIIPILGAHTAGYGVFAEPQEKSTGHRLLRQALLFTFGVFLTIPLYGLLVALLGHGLEMEDHFWTVPVGLLLVWFGWDMMRAHVCSHAGHIMDSLRRRLGLTPNSGVFVLGFGYGLLAGGCTVSFLVPLLVLMIPYGVLPCVFLAACFGIGHCLPMVAVGYSAPLAKRLVHARHAADNALYDHDHKEEPHTGEALFRRIMGIVVIVIGVLFVLHPFLEH